MLFKGNLLINPVRAERFKLSHENRLIAARRLSNGIAGWMLRAAVLRWALSIRRTRMLYLHGSLDNLERHIRSSCYSFDETARTRKPCLHLCVPSVPRLQRPSASLTSLLSWDTRERLKVSLCLAEPVSRNQGSMKGEVPTLSLFSLRRVSPLWRHLFWPGLCTVK